MSETSEDILSVTLLSDEEVNEQLFELKTSTLKWFVSVVVVDNCVGSHEMFHDPHLSLYQDTMNEITEHWLSVAWVSDGDLAEAIESD